MKKNITLFLALGLFATIMQASPVKITVDRVRYQLDEKTKTAMVVSDGYNSYFPDVESFVIRSSVSYNGSSYTVTSIEDEAFRDCFILKSITLPNTLKTIGKQAFSDCSNLTSVTIPENLESLGVRAFESCYKLRSVVWNAKHASSMQSVNPFSGDPITSFEFGNMVEHIPDYLCEALSIESVVIPNSVISIGDFAFYLCGALQSVHFGNKVQSIGMASFSDCALTSLTLPASVQSIDGLAFDRNQLTSISSWALTPPQCGTSAFGTKVASIQVYIMEEAYFQYRAANVWKNFSNIIPIGKCDNIRYFLYVEDRKAVVTYNADIDTNYRNLTRVKIPANIDLLNTRFNVVAIGESAFINSPNITSIVLPETIETIEENAFNGGNSVQKITCHATTPPVVQQGALTGISKSTPVYVPTTSVNLYKNAAIWKEFAITDIALKPFDPEEDEHPYAIELTEDEPDSKNSKILRDGKILILRGDRTYTLTGQQIQ